jgi:hypothetical protein
MDYRVKPGNDEIDGASAHFTYTATAGTSK